MSQWLCFALVVVAWLVFGGVGTALGRRSDEAGSTNNSDAVFGVLFGTGGALMVGVALHYLGFW